MRMSESCRQLQQPARQPRRPAKRCRALAAGLAPWSKSARACKPACVRVALSEPASSCSCRFAAVANPLVLCSAKIEPKRGTVVPIHNRHLTLERCQGLQASLREGSAE